MCPRFSSRTRGETRSLSGYGLAGNESFGTANQINFRDPYVTQWTLTVERELGAQTGVRLNYTGMHTTGMPVSEDYNQIPAQDTPFNPRRETLSQTGSQVKSRTNAGVANYNALNLVVTHRYNAGVFLQSSYPRSRGICRMQKATIRRATQGKRPEPGRIASMSEPTTGT